MNGRGNSGSSTMGQKSVDELIVEYRAMIQTGRSVAPFASDNLAHWLGNTGTTRSVSSSYFSQDSSVISHLRSKHRAVFLSEHSRTMGIVP